MSDRCESGFSLIEVVVVLAILAIMATAAGLRYQHVSEAVAQKTTCQALKSVIHYMGDVAVSRRVYLAMGVENGQPVYYSLDVGRHGEAAWHVWHDKRVLLELPQPLYVKLSAMKKEKNGQHQLNHHFALVFSPQGFSTPSRFQLMNRSTADAVCSFVTDAQGQVRFMSKEVG